MDAEEFKKRWEGADSEARFALLRDHPEYHIVALNNSALNGDKAMVEHLVIWEGSTVDIGANGGDWALINASRGGHAEIVKLLLEAGVNIFSEGGRALTSASALGHAEVVRLLLAAADSDLPEWQFDLYNQSLPPASSNGHVEIVRMLLAAGADADAVDGSALYVASVHGHVEVLRILLEAGAISHAVNDRILERAEKNGHAEVVELLRKSR